MSKKKSAQLSTDQIVTNLWDVEAHLARGQTVDEALRDVGISKPNYDRWTREYGGRKPPHVKSLEAFVAAEGKGAILDMLGKVPELFRHQDEGRAPKGIDFGLAFKLAVLTKAYGTCVNTDQQLKIARQGEAGSLPSVGLRRISNKINEIIKTDFDKLIQFYMKYMKSKEQQIEGTLVADIALDMKGNLGIRVSANLASFFSDQELSENQMKELVQDWQIMTPYVEQVASMAKGAR